MSQSGYVHLENCTVRRETDNALLVVYDGESLWLPKSQVADAENYAAGDEDVTISMTEWIARQKGIEVQ